jgi:FkbM family methyltransferase
MKFLLRAILGSKYSIFVRNFWKINASIYPIFFKKKGTLIYSGINLGDSFQKIFFKYEKVYGFEPNPVNYKKLNYFRRFKGVKIYNLALSDKDGETSFFLPDNPNNVSASLSDFREDNVFSIKSKRTIRVKTINLLNFLIKNQIDFIDFYISDIEGYDFKVLKTIRSFIDSKQIKSIQVEALINEVKNPYLDILNYEKNFDDLLEKNYTKIGREKGFVKAGDTGDNYSISSTIDLLYELKK